MNRRTLISATALTIVIVVVFLVLISPRIFVWPPLFVAGRPNLVRNGSFEDGNKAAEENQPFIQSGKDLCAGSSALTSWQVFRKPNATTCTPPNGTDAVFWAGTPNNFNNIPVPAADGEWFLDLTGFAGRPPATFGGVMQDVQNTQPGRLYELSFAVGSAGGYQPPTPQDSVAVSVEIKGVLSRIFPSTVPPKDKRTETKWETFTVRFRAVDQTTTITFTGEAGGDYIGIDNVSLQKVCFIVIAILYGCS